MQRVFFHWQLMSLFIVSIQKQIEMGKNWWNSDLRGNAKAICHIDWWYPSGKKNCKGKIKTADATKEKIHKFDVKSPPYKEQMSKMRDELGRTAVKHRATQVCVEIKRAILQSSLRSLKSTI